MSTRNASNRRIVISTTANNAYAATKVCGGVLTIPPNAGDPGSLTLMLQSIFLKCKSNITPAFTLYFFDSNPSAGTYTDTGTLAWNAADFAFLIGRHTVAAADWLADNSQQTASYGNIMKELVMTTSTLYALAVATGAFTPTGVADITLDLNLLNN